ncbi:MAG: hypothetical protein V1927_01105 [Candidatus Omnitrophota bacterium]
MRMKLSGKKGFILLLTLIFMTVLGAIVGSMIYMITCEGRSVVSQLDDVILKSLADAGIERAYRVLRDDYLNPSLTGFADLRGADTSLSSPGVKKDYEMMRYIDDKCAAIDSNSDQAIIRTFDSNCANSRIASNILFVRAGRASEGTGAALQFSYTTDGVNYISQGDLSLPAYIFDYSLAVVPDLTWAQAMSPDFRLRGIRTGVGTSDVYVDAMYVRILYGIDSLRDSWSTGSYAAFPMSFGAGTIESVAITDEESKIHLNTASQPLLLNLMQNCGIPGSAAYARSIDIINYRAVKPFYSVEELQQIPGFTPEIYNPIKDYVTVYSYINQNAYNAHTVGSASAARAPVNINTAPFQILKTIFDPLPLGAGISTSLADDIIASRSSGPFTGFYNRLNLSTGFVGFINTRSYLNAIEKNTIIDNADASLLAPVSGFTNTVQTTEFCYAGTAFMVNCLVSYNNRGLRVRTILGNDGARTFRTYAGDPVPAGWRKENFE